MNNTEITDMAHHKNAINKHCLYGKMCKF